MIALADPTARSVVRSVGPKHIYNYGGVASDMSRQDGAKSIFSQEFMTPVNLGPILARLHREVIIRRRGMDTEMNWQFVYKQLVLPFVTVARRQFENLKDANLLFWNSMCEPWLCKDSKRWHFTYELMRKRNDGIDVNQLRRHSNVPSILGYGIPRESNKATRGRGGDLATYNLSHPFSKGRERQKRALAIQSLQPIKQHGQVTNCVYRYR